MALVLCNSAAQVGQAKRITVEDARKTIARNTQTTSAGVIALAPSVSSKLSGDVSQSYVTPVLCCAFALHIWGWEWPAAKLTPSFLPSFVFLLVSGVHDGHHGHGRPGGILVHA